MNEPPKDTDFIVHFYPQTAAMECGPVCLQMILKYYSMEYSFEFLKEITGFSGTKGVTLLGLSQAAEKIGFKTINVKISLKKLSKDAPMPCILHWNNCHFVILYKIQKLNSNNDKIYFIAGPALGNLSFNEADFGTHWLIKGTGNNLHRSVKWKRRGP
jgi:ATP-binding cassette subfamily B protein